MRLDGTDERAPREGQRRSEGTAAILAFAGLLLFACGDAASVDGSGVGAGAEASGDEPAPGPTGTASDSPLDVASRQGCRIDAECALGHYCFQSHCSFECVDDDGCGSGETCSERGRCVSAASPEAEEPPPALEEFESRVTVTGTSSRLIEVDPEQVFVTFTLSLDGSLPPPGLAYRVERDDGDVGDPDAGTIRRVRASGTELTIEVPTGLARATTSGTRPVRVQLITALGTFPLTLTPKEPEAGHYAGSVQMRLFGNTGLPLELDLVTMPEEAPLDQAEQAWLVLPASDDSLFAPFRPVDGSREALQLPLEYDPSLDRWVAISEAEFSLGSESALYRQARPIARIQRFEIEVRDVLYGVVSDRWEGLYDARSDQGVVTSADVVFEGELELERTGPALYQDALSAPPHAALPVPLPLPAPTLDACAGSDLFAAETEGACAGIDDASDFERSVPDARADCALALAEVALGGQTTGAALRAFLDGDDENPDGQSFADFMRDCADESHPTCRPSAEVLCARQLIALASYDQQSGGTLEESLTKTFQDVSSEAFLGRQLAAFQTNADTRLRWLETTNYPAIVLSEVKSNVAELLDDWQGGVLDPHMSVLRGYFDDSGLTVMSRAAGGEAKDARRRLLDQSIQGWRGAMDALTLGASRWDELYQDADSRADRASYVRFRMRDLYLMAGLLGNLSRDAGSGYQASAFGSGFAQLMKRAGKLDLPFDDLVFARDAEVVVSMSLDPTSDNASLLEQRQQAAEKATEAAQVSVAELLEDDAEEQKERLDYEARISGELSDVRRELVNLCGLPEGCQTDGLDLGAAPSQCSVRVAAGQCGFSVDGATDELVGFADSARNTSEAASAVLAFLDAAQAMTLADEETRAFSAKVTHEYAFLEALAAKVEEWNAERGEQLAELGELTRDVALWESRGLADLRANLEERSEIRQEAIAEAEAQLAKWDRVVQAGVDEDTADARTIAGIRTAATVADSGATLVSDLGAAAAEAIPSGLDDAAAPGRGAALLGAAKWAFVLRGVSIAGGAAADYMEINLEKQKELRELRVQKMDREDALDDAVAENDLLDLEQALTLARAENASEVAQLERAYELARATREAQLAYERDLLELEDRRKSLLQMVEDEAGYRLRAARAELGVQAKVMEYQKVVQRAELLHGRLADLVAQQGDMDRLLGSPATVFTRSNRLEQAERQLQRAKDKLMDWLVALEYYAVRPFIDQRLQILLARNPYQLEAIAQNMEEVQLSCGGRPSVETVELSVRDRLFKLTHPITDAVSQEATSVVEQFRAILREGDVPVDKRVRYGVHSNLDDLLSVDGRVLATTVDINLNEFANLGAVCNAKLLSFDVQLVGSETQARPTVSVLYDGTSQIASCQPDIESLVEQIGRERTTFDKVTLVRVPGVVASPVASVNAWPDDEDGGNTTFEGLPIASQYTLLIDTAGGENDEFDWSELEDIRLKLRYTYNDPFAGDACRP